MKGGLRSEKCPNNSDLSYLEAHVLSHNMKIFICSTLCSSPFWTLCISLKTDSNDVCQYSNYEQYSSTTLWAFRVHFKGVHCDSLSTHFVREALGSLGPSTKAPWCKRAMNLKCF